MTDLLKPGEIGVLQNLPEEAVLKNGGLAEVLSIGQPHFIVLSNGLLNNTNMLYIIKPLPDYAVDYHPRLQWGCEFHQLRRLTDPDAEQTLTEENKLSLADG
jgi:hypothetical protein